MVKQQPHYSPVGLRACAWSPANALPALPTTHIIFTHSQQQRLDPNHVDQGPCDESSSTQHSFEHRTTAGLLHTSTRALLLEGWQSYFPDCALLVEHGWEGALSSTGPRRTLVRVNESPRAPRSGRTRPSTQVPAQAPTGRRARKTTRILGYCMDADALGASGSSWAAERFSTAGFKGK